MYYNCTIKDIDIFYEIFELVRIRIISLLFLVSSSQTAGIYLLKANNKNTAVRCEICLKLKLKKPEWPHCRRFGDFIFNFEHISHLVLVSLSLTLSK